MNNRLRVVQWATGNIGMRSLRAVIEHPDLELAGLWVNNPAKAGVDAGTLAQTAVTGIIATTSLDEIVAIAADCVLYMGNRTDIAALCRLLASGKNIVTTRGDFHHPRSMDPGARTAITAACAAGQSAIYSTGSSPGFSTEALVIPLLSLSRRLDCLTIDEFGDLESRNSPDLLFNIMGYGAPCTAFDQRRTEFIKHDFVASLAQIAGASGIAIDSWDAFGEYAGARHRTEIAAGTIDAGTVAAQRITITGSGNGRPRLRFRANWFVTRDITEPGWDLRNSGWRVRIEGDTPLDVSITFPVAPEAYAAFTPGLTAHRAVNAVAAVCAGAPGIRTTVDLPQIVPNLT